MPHFKAADGTQLFYTDTGVGRPLVLIHGWPLNSAMWEYQVDALSEEGIRCIAYDRRGFGRSDHPATGYDYDTLADDLSSLLDHLDVTGVTLAGFSMGGGEVARYMSRHRSARVARVALISAVTPYMLKTDANPTGVDAAIFEDMREKLRADRPAFLVSFAETFFGVGMFSSPVSSAMLDAAFVEAMKASSRATLQCLDAFSKTDFRGDLASFRAPTLIIHGDADKTVPIEVSARQAAKLLPSAQFVTYSDAPHALFFTHRDRLNADLMSFVRNGSLAGETLAVDAQRAELAVVSGMSMVPAV